MLKKIPFIIVLLSMFLGVFIAIMFGINESYFKNKIANGLKLNQKIMSIQDNNKRKAKLKSEGSKNWRYYQRFHFHSTGISSMSLGILILLSFSLAPCLFKIVASWLTAVGGFLYPFVWLFAGLYGPEMGRHAAKESFAIFGYMGGLFLIGILVSLFIIVKYPIDFKLTKHNK